MFASICFFQHLLKTLKKLYCQKIHISAKDATEVLTLGTDLSFQQYRELSQNYKPEFLASLCKFFILQTRK